jgi:hypothetical protein
MKSPKKKMPAKKQKQQPNYNSDTVTIDGSYGAVPYTTNIGGSIGTDTITLNNTLWSGGSITSPYTTTTTVPNGGYTVSTGAGSGYNWSTGTINTNAKVHINGDGLVMQEGADIVVGGKSLSKAIEQIEERLGILHPNPALEERWDKLKELRQQYVEMEKDLLEKEKLMKILKEA